MSIILSTAYNAPIQYYSKLLMNKPVIIDIYEHFVKQSYRNRCIICSADGLLPLSIPVIYSSREKTLTKDVRIAYDTNWQHMHWNALLSSYNSTPFFEYYADDYRILYENQFKYLLDFNQELFRLTCDNLNLDVSSISLSKVYKEINLDDVDYRSLINPKVETTKDKTFKNINYYQIFANKYGFQSNVSILDLLFNMGNESIFVLQDSINKAFS